jgi:hypothetical protein
MTPTASRWRMTCTASRWRMSRGAQRWRASMPWSSRRNAPHPACRMRWRIVRHGGPDPLALERRGADKARSARQESRARARFGHDRAGGRSGPEGRPRDALSWSRKARPARAVRSWAGSACRRNGGRGTLARDTCFNGGTSCRHGLPPHELPLGAVSLGPPSAASGLCACRGGTHGRTCHRRGAKRAIRLGLCAAQGGKDTANGRRRRTRLASPQGPRCGRMLRPSGANAVRRASRRTQAPHMMQRSGDGAAGLALALAAGPSERSGVRQGWQGRTGPDKPGVRQPGSTRRHVAPASVVAQSRPCRVSMVFDADAGADAGSTHGQHAR